MNLTLIMANGSQFHAEADTTETGVLLLQVRDRAGFCKGGWIPAQETALAGHESGPSCLVNLDHVVAISFDE